jgi:hypothetical protein
MTRVSSVKTLEAFSVSCRVTLRFETCVGERQLGWESRDALDRQGLLTPYSCILSKLSTLLVSLPISLQHKKVNAEL